MAGLKYWVWLSEVKGLTNRSKLLLLDYFGTPENVYYADEDEYRLVEGIEPRQIALLAEKSLENADRILGACSRLGLRLLTMQDADYPMRLRNIFEPPCLLYVKGQLPVIDEEVAVAMVGTRKASPYGIEAAEKIAYGLCKQGAVVISGAAAALEGENALTADLSGPLALVIGSEGEGISRLTLSLCDRRVTLPMLGKISSLNASVAAGILMSAIYEGRTKR